MAATLGTDYVLTTWHPEWFGTGGRAETPGALALLLSCSLGAAVLTGYVTGWVARTCEVRHALVMGVLQLAMGTAAIIAYFEVAPAWYYVTFLALLLPAHVFGGWVRAQQRRRLLVNTHALKTLL